jgi:hypothetical protein
MASGSPRARLRYVGATYLLIPAWALVAIGVWLAVIAAGSLILDPRYRPAIDLSIWFLIGGGVTAISLTVCGLFFFTSKNEWLTVATVATAVVASVLAPALTTSFGLQGSAMSFLCVQMVLLALSWLLSLRVQPMPWRRPLLAVRVFTRALAR